MRLTKLKREFFKRKPLEVAEDLVGSFLVRRVRKPEEESYTLAQISEVRAFEGIGRKMNPWGMRRLYGLFYLAPYRGRKLLNVTTTISPSMPSCVWIYSARIEEEEYGPSQLVRELKIDERFDGLSVESEELFFLKGGAQEIEESRWSNAPRNYVGGFKLRIP